MRSGNWSEETFGHLGSVDKRRNVPGNISSIRQQCALWKSHQASSHKSWWDPFTLFPGLGTSNSPASASIELLLHLLAFFARPHYFKEFLLYFGTLLLSSFVGATFCWGHVARSILQGGKKGRVAIWQLAAVAEAVVAKAQKTSPASLISDPAWWSAPFTCYLQDSN